MRCADGLTTSEVRANLSQIAARFRAGDLEPVIFGVRGRVEAVVVPFRVWEKLLEPLEDEGDVRVVCDRIAADAGDRFSTVDVEAAIGISTKRRRRSR